MSVNNLTNFQIFSAMPKYNLVANKRYDTVEH